MKRFRLLLCVRILFIEKVKKKHQNNVLKLIVFVLNTTYLLTTHSPPLYLCMCINIVNIKMMKYWWTFLIL